MAEAIFRFYAKESGVKADVSSYGLFINPDECETRGQALIAVRKLNIPIRKKKSKVITEDVVKNADYVVTMTKKQKDALPYDNVFTFSELVGGGVYDSVMNRVMKAVAGKVE